MVEADLDAADRVFRLAFGTFVGLPDPMAFAGDSDWVRPRWRAAPDAAFVAERDGVLVGSNLASRWGSFGFFGPLSVAPSLWNAGVGRKLLVPVLDCFARWEVRHAGIFTFAESAKHVTLYRRHGFWPRFLTVVLARDVPAGTPPPDPLSAVPSGERDAVLAAGRACTGAVFPGLDLTAEIDAVAGQGLGDTVLVRDGERVGGLALCHLGTGSEAGSDTCYVKFGAVRPGPDAAARFARLLDGVDGLAAARGAHTVLAGVNTARRAAWEALTARGFRTAIQGVSMSRDGVSGWDEPGSFVLDDWR
ncbi:MAG: GNAT family N-acetyltransferase [bacterium]|nr:GNAT family N-acetyltransferase [bacterium]